MHARPIRSSLGPDPNGSAPVCTGPKADTRISLKPDSIFLLKVVKRCAYGICKNDSSYSNDPSVTNRYG